MPSGVVGLEIGIAGRERAERLPQGRVRVPREEEDRGELGAGREGQGQPVGLRAGVGPLVREHSLAGRLELERREQRQASTLSPSREIPLAIDVRRGSLVFDQCAVPPPGGEALGRRGVARVALALREDEMNRVVRTAFPQLDGQRGVDDVVRWGDEVGGRSGRFPEANAANGDSRGMSSGLPRTGVGRSPASL